MGKYLTRVFFLLCIFVCCSLSVHSQHTAIYKLNPRQLDSLVFMNQLPQNQLLNKQDFLVKADKVNKLQIEIKAMCFEMDKFWKFSIADNGPGIDPQFHDKIFMIFQTLKARDEFEATGVGLAIVKKLVEEAGGRIWLDSQMNMSTTFNFTIPKQTIDQGLFMNTPVVREKQNV